MKVIPYATDPRIEQLRPMFPDIAEELVALRQSNAHLIGQLMQHADDALCFRWIRARAARALHAFFPGQAITDGRSERDGKLLVDLIRADIQSDHDQRDAIESYNAQYLTEPAPPARLKRA